MAITHIDVPGNIAALEPIDFTTTTKVVVVSVEYESGGWEVVWQDGTFAARYLANSTFIPTDPLNLSLGGAWSVRRSTAWPGRFRLVVDEETPIPTSGQAMSVVYEVNFMEQDAQSFVTPGAYTIAGRTWYMKGPLTGNVSGLYVQENTLVAGEGLSLRFVSGGNGRPTHTSGQPYPWRACFFPFAQLPGFNPLAPTWVRWVSSGQYASLNAGMNAHGGLLAAALDGVAITWTERQKWHLLSIEHVTAAATGATEYRTNLSAGFVMSGWSSTQEAHHEMAFYREPLSQTDYPALAAAPWTGDWATELLSGYGNSSSFYAPLRTTRTAENFGFVFLCGGQSTTLPIYLRRLRIEQPKVAA